MSYTGRENSTTKFWRADGVFAVPSVTSPPGAPVDADYLVKTANGDLSAERVVTDGTTITADWSVGGQVTFIRAALSGDVTASANSNTTTIANDAVSNAKLADMDQSLIKGRAAAAGTGDPQDLTATQVRTILNVADGANAYVHPNHSGDVTSVGDGAQTIANDVVTYAKMQNVSATSRLLGRRTAGAGDPEECTASQALDFVGTTRGSVLYRGSSGWAILAPGTSGDVLTSNGAGADPSYQTPAGGSGPATGTMVLADDESNATGSLASIVAFGVEDLDPDSWYELEYKILWRSDTTASGVVFSVYTNGASDAAQLFRAHIEVPTSGSTTVERWQIAEESGTLTTSLVIDAANATRFAIIRCLMLTGATTPNPVLIRYHGESGATITVKAGTAVRYTKLG